MPDDGKQDVVPQPDPTRLTTAALLREVASLRELLQAEIRALEAKLDANDEHHRTLHKGEMDLRGEQHGSITEQVQRVDQRIDSELRSRDRALDVALITMKEKVDDLKTLLDRQVIALESKLTSVQERSDQQIESLKEANTLATGRLAGKEYSWQQMVAAAGLAIALLVLVAMIILGVFT